MLMLLMVIKESMEHGVDNVLFTIKLYQDGAEVGDAIFHMMVREKALSWPIITENGGHYQVDRIEAPGKSWRKKLLLCVAPV